MVKWALTNKSVKGVKYNADYRDFRGKLPEVRRGYLPCGDQSTDAGRPADHMEGI